MISASLSSANTASIIEVAPLLAEVNTRLAPEGKALDWPASYNFAPRFLSAARPEWVRDVRFRTALFVRERPEWAQTGHDRSWPIAEGLVPGLRTQFRTFASEVVSYKVTLPDRRWPHCAMTDVRRSLDYVIG
jgi:hypothetical protein